MKIGHKLDGIKYHSEDQFLSTNNQYTDYKVGEWSYGHPRVLSWDEGSTLRIGKFCSISEEVTILLGGNHRTDWVTTYPFSDLFNKASSFEGHPQSKGDVIIGNDVWIAREVTILSGVTIGNGAVIGARSLVAKDVAAYSIVAGNPAHHIRFRFSSEQINLLQEIAWWDWPLQDIEQAWPLLLSPNIDDFISIYKNKSR